MSRMFMFFIYWPAAAVTSVQATRDRELTHTVTSVQAARDRELTHTVTSVQAARDR